METRTWSFEGPVVCLGCDEGAEVPLPLPGVLPLHAAIIVERDAAFLRARGEVRVNGRPASEAPLEDGDLIELPSGIRLQVKLPPLGRQGEPEAAHLPLAPARILHGRAGAALTLVFLALLVGGAYIATREKPRDLVAERLAHERARQDRLRAAQEKAHLSRLEGLKTDMLSLETRMADRSEVDARMGEVQRSVAEVERTVLTRVGDEIEASLGRRPELKAARDALRKIEERDAAAARIIDSHAPGVCLIQGAYGFGKLVKGKWRFLREADAELLQEMKFSGDSVPLTLAGSGRIFTVEYTGTGFLADENGIVLTNRHIAEPWWRNDAAEPLINEGYTPRFVALRAYFPGRVEPVNFDLERTVISGEVDLAALRCPPFEGMPRPLPLAPEGAVVAGQRVMLLGYPSGLDALVARGEDELTVKVSGGDVTDATALLDELAERHLVRPLPTQGHIGDVLEDKILFDARTAVGGSGGPLLDLEGRVVAINYGILKAFSGANFGVPATAAARLLEEARAE